MLNDQVCRLQKGFIIKQKHFYLNNSHCTFMYISRMEIEWNINWIFILANIDVSQAYTKCSQLIIS